MMADYSSSRRRRSPESSVGGSRRKERERDSRRAPSETVYDDPRMRSGPPNIPIDRGAHGHAYGGNNTYLSSSSSSNSSYELVDISRTFPANRSGIKTFFTAPSEHRQRKLRRRKSNRMFRLNNSSSSSVNSDLAYGTGYIKRSKLRRVRSKEGKIIDKESYRYSDSHRTKYGESGRYSGSEKRGYGSGSERRGYASGSERRGNTEAEILAVGAGLAALAREQNKHDLKNRNGRSPQLAAVKQSSQYGGAHSGSRGLSSSKVSHGSHSSDEDGWESASDAESEDSVDSRLAFGAEASGWWGKKKHYPLSRKDTVVDPRLFGPENSLRGYVDHPVGFGTVTWTSTEDFGQQYREHSTPVVRNESFSGSQASLQQVFPVQNSRDPTRFDAARNSVASGSEPFITNRPGPAPLQHPQPYTPVSQSIFEPNDPAVLDNTRIMKLKKPTSPSGRSNSLAQAAFVGVAGAAVGAAIASRHDDRKEKRREDDRDETSRISSRRREEEREDASRISSKRREDDRDDTSLISSKRKGEDRDISSRVDLKRRDSDKKESKDERRKDKRDSPDRDDRKDKRRDKDRKKDGSRYSDEERREKKREKRRDEAREETRDERRDKRREKEDRRAEKSEVATRPETGYDDRRSKSEAAITTVSKIDPFMFQVADNAFPTPSNEFTDPHQRHDSMPQVVTVERVPDFSREVGSSTKDYDRDYSQYDDRDKEYRSSVNDHGLHEAEEAYRETKHSTAPIAAGAIGAAAAVVATDMYRERSEKRRNERRSAQPSSDYNDQECESRGREPVQERDPIQEEADRAYREIVMARKIASQVIRSRSNSPDGSVVGRYNRKEEPEEVQIVTPPEMDHPKIKGPYDAPNADFSPDHHFDDPRELRHFRPETPVIYGEYKDPGASEPRPLLNLVRPTPAPSPLPEKQASKAETSRSERTRSKPAKSEPSRSEPARSDPSTKSSKSRDRSDLTRSESGRPDAARSEPPTRSSKSRDRNERIRTAVSEVGRSNGMDSPTSSTISKGVTWGENETKHFDVESPSDHREEYISSSDIPAYEKSPQPTSRSESKSDTKPSKGWGAIAAALVGAGAGAAAASSSDTPESKTSKSNMNEREKSPPKGYEYRGVVIEPESPQSKDRRRSPPSPGPKPTPDLSHMPGAFADDSEFTAVVAAGLKDAGFNDDIVIEDPAFRKRSSPPGSNDRIYQAPYSETVSDLGHIPATASGVSGSGFFMGDAPSTSQDPRSISPEGDEFIPKLSKKEQKKRDKAKRQSVDVSPPAEETPPPKEQDQDFYFNEPKLSKKEQKKREKEAKRQSSLAEDITPIAEPIVAKEVFEEPEAYFETPKKKKKSKRDSAVYDDDGGIASPTASSSGRRVSIPVDAFDDLQKEGEDWTDTKKSKSKRESVPVDAYDDLQNDGDEWTDSKKSKSKSKRDSERFDSPSRSVAASETSERSSSKRKDKSRSNTDEYDRDPAEISLPPVTPSEASQDRDYDESRTSRKSRDSGIYDSRDRSVVSEAASRYDDEPRRKKKSSRSSTRDRDDFDDTRSVVSVASAPAGDDDRKSKKKDKEKKGGFFGLFGSKSEVGAREESPKGSKDEFDDVKSKKKKKRHSMPDASSLYGDLGSQSVGDLSRSTSNGHGSGRYDDDDEVRSDGERKKSRSRANSSSSKRESFLGNTDTLGARVGIVSAAAAIAQQHEQSNAEDAYEEALHKDRLDGNEGKRDIAFDPEITQRHFRPSIDPQYGDLLPLPPSEPPTPGSEDFEDLPGLPESRPDTPEEERLMRERFKTSTRRLYDTPVKSPSHSAVPLNMNFRMGKGKISAPSSPGLPRATPLQSPATPNTEAFSFSRGSRNRPTSWESAKEYRPLYLPESVRRGSNVRVTEEEEEANLQELPASMTSSRTSSRHELDDSSSSHDEFHDFPAESPDQFHEPLSIDTGIGSYEHSGLLDSQQSTPKAKFSFDNDEKPEASSQYHSRDMAASVIAGAALVGTAAYLASEHRDDADKPASIERQPSPIEPMSKDRSSYLLQSSPMSKKDDSTADSPSQNKSTLAGVEALDSIQEGDRERTLEALVGQIPTAEADLNDFSFSKSKKDKKKDKKKGKLSRSATQEDVSLPQLATEEIPTQSMEMLEDEFAAPKSKKDKKKGKLSRSTTQEDLSFPEFAPVEIPEIPVQTTELPDDDFATPKSKKDKKKDKKKAKSLPALEADNVNTTGIDDNPAEELLIGDPSQPSVDEITPAIEAADAADDFFTPSKKDKKKNKKQKSEFSWEPEPEMEAFESPREAAIHTSGEPVDNTSAPAWTHTPEDLSNSSNLERNDGGPSNLVTLLSTNPVVMPEEETTEDFTISDRQIDQEPNASVVIDEDQPQFSVGKSKKGKEDKKGKSKINRNSEPEELSQAMKVPLPDATRQFGDHAATLVEPEAIGDSFSFKSKKDKKRDKKKGQIVDAPVDIMAEAEPDATFQAEPVLETPLETSTPAEPEAFDDSFFVKSKKDKKKDKKGKFVDEVEPYSAVQLESAVETPTLESSTPTIEETDDFFAPKSKKDKKKDKKKEKATDADTWATELVPEVTAKDDQLETDLDSAQDSFHDFPPEENAGETSMAIPNPEAEDISKQETSPADILAEELSVPNEFSFQESKKGKKKKGKGVAQSEGTEETISTPLPRDIDDASEFLTPGSKKGKKKGKKNTAGDAEPEHTPATPSDTFDHEPVADLESQNVPSAFEDYTTPSTSKSKNKGKKSQTWDVEPESTLETSHVNREVMLESQDTITAPDTYDDSAASTSKKGKKKGKKAQLWDNDDYPSTPQDLATPENFSAKPTPMVGPGGWIETPATASNSARDESFHNLGKGSQDKDYFSSAVLPGVAVLAGAALLATNESGSQTPTEDRSLEPHSEQPTPDGLAAGYKDDQLSLAKQLQEEFNSKKSKKDKKKRQSLPATPNPEEDRSRSMANFGDDAPRARSLSVAPPADDDKPKSPYSEDQLELARQLKADFEKGSSKKSKKGKKKQLDDWDDAVPDQASEETQFQAPMENLPEPAVADDTPKGDGLTAGYKQDQLELAQQLKAEFGKGNNKKSRKDRKKKQNDLSWDDSTPEPLAEDSTTRELGAREEVATLDVTIDPTKGDGLSAGYQEDQLSLARQLQAEFGKKSSKKDKKRRSTSQTPQTPPTPQNAESVDDYFGEPSQSSTTEPQAEPQDADPTPVETTREVSDMVPDGLAAGYKEDQLELARQLKEEFGSTSSKKSKKDKKSKKRANFDDDFLPETPASEQQDPYDQDIMPSVETPPVVETEDNYGFSSKKSKKDKKGKKRGNFEDDSLPATPVIEQQDSLDQDITPSVETPPIVEPEDDCGFSSKKSKKDKKGKKRDIANSPAIESENLLEEAAPTIEEPTLVAAEDEFAFTSTKKSKKDKRGRKTDSSEIPPVPETPIEEALQLVDEPAQVEDVVRSVDEPTPVDAEGQFTFTSSKKSKKGKKRDTSEPPSVPDSSIDGTTSVHVDESSTLESPTKMAVPALEEPLAGNADDEYSFTPTKKSKKDKKGKKRDISEPSFEAETPSEIATSTPEEPLSENVDEDSTFTSGKMSKKDKKGKSREVPDAALVPSLEGSPPVTEQPAEAENDFAFSMPKKPKKDKKKRGSLLRHSSTYDDFTVEPIEAEPASTQPDILDSAATPETQHEHVSMHDLPTREEKLPDVDAHHVTSGNAIEPQAAIALEPVVNSDDVFTTSQTSADGTELREPEVNENSNVLTPLDHPLTSTTENPELPMPSLDTAQNVEAREPSATLDADETGTWDEFAPKKSKKDKRKKKDLPSESGEASGISAPLDVTQEAKKDSTGPPPSDSVFNNSTRLDQTRELDPKELPATQEHSPEQEEWSSTPSRKSSKKDKKQKSGTSTPVDSVPEQIPLPEEQFTAEPSMSAATHQEPEDQTNLLDTSSSRLEEVAQEVVDDEWASNSKKSKKDKKKNRKSDLSTPLDTPVEEVAEPLEYTSAQLIGQDEPSASTKEVEQIAKPKDIQSPVAEEHIQEPVDDDWAAIPSKQSKKDKKKNRNSTISTPSEAVVAALGPSVLQYIIPDPSVDMEIAGQLTKSEDVPPPSTEDSFQEPVDDDWAAIPTKKSKKDKKGGKSGVSIPVEHIPEAPKEAPAPSETAGSGAHADELSRSAEKFIDDEPALLPSSQDPEVKESDNFDIPLSNAELLDPTTLGQETRDIDTLGFNTDDVAEKSTEPATNDWDTFTTPGKKSKKDKKKNKTGLSTARDEISETTASFEQTETEVPVIAPETVAEPLAGEDWGLFATTKKSKKDKKKNKSGLSTPKDEILDVTTALETGETTGVPVITPETVVEPAAEDDWNSFATSSKKSKKDKKNKSGISTPNEDLIQPGVMENLHISAEPNIALKATKSLADDWTLPSKKSKKDKKSGKSGISTPVEEPIREDTFEEADRFVEPVEPAAMPEAIGPVVEEPVADEWALPSKKSKKDKKKNKSGMATPVEEPIQANIVEEAGRSPEPVETAEVADTTPISETLEPVADEWALPTKKSKKDKKKNKSSIDTPVEESSKLSTVDEYEAPAETISVPESKSDDTPFHEWAMPSKKSKKDKKNNSNIAAPVEEPTIVAQKPDEIEEPNTGPEVNVSIEPVIENVTYKPAEMEELTVNREVFETPGPVTDKLVIQESVQDEPQIEALALDREVSADPIDEWSLPSKKSKKDKKNRKSGLSTPTEEFITHSNELKAEDTIPAPTESEQRTAERDISQDEIEEWSVPSKKSKNDRKKSKSGFQTLIEEPVVSAKELETDDTAQAPLQPEDPLPTEEASPEHVDEWSMPTKKSKNDKKKQKSGFSTPINEQVEASTVPILEDVAQEPVTAVEPAQFEQEPADEWSIPSKKSKKDKKKQKSSFSTPLDEVPSFTAPEKIFDEPYKSLDPPESTRDVKAEKADEPELQATKITDDFDENAKGNSSTGAAIAVGSTAAFIAGVVHADSFSTDSTEKKDEPVEEWDSFSTKKSKKGKKKKSGSATPQREITEDPIVAPIIEETFNNDSYPTASSTDTVEPAVFESVPAEEEWGSFSLKKSKKDKKGKGKQNLVTEELEDVQEPAVTSPIVASPMEVFETPMEELTEPTLAPKSHRELDDLTVPVVETPMEVFQTPFEEIPEPALSREVVQEPADEWSSFTPSKKSKKDKKGKRNSYFDEPDQVLESLVTVPENTESSQTPSEAIIQFVPLQPPQEAAPSQTLKREPEAGFEDLRKPDEHQPAAERFAGIVPDEEPMSHEATRDLEDEWGSVSIRKGKKDKKGKGKNKESFDTSEDPVIEQQPVVHPVEVVNEPIALEETSKQDVETTPLGQDEDFGSYSLKKSKKDKKKRKSGISTPIEEKPSFVEPEFTEPILETVGNTNDNITSTPFYTEPEEFGKPDPEQAERAEEIVKEEQPEGYIFTSKKSKKDKKGKRGSRVDSFDVSPSTTTPAEAEDSTVIAQEEHTLISKGVSFDDMPISHSVQSEDDASFQPSFSRSSSKKDKRKRQGTTDPIPVDESSLSQALVTTWAEEIEEAEVERVLPVIEEIDHDQSLSHIAKTTEGAPVDDFVRPNKKGKKGKKTKSIDNSRAPVTFSPSTKESTKEESGTAELVVEAAAIGGAAIGSGFAWKSSEVKKEPVKEERPEAPVRKLSKKEKRKQSIDKRTPTSDIFDHDALWEGADPKEFEEKAPIEDDDHDDGFWSPPQRESFQTAETSFQEPTMSRGSTMGGENEPFSGPSTLPIERPLSPPDDLTFAETLPQDTTPTPSTRGLSDSEHQQPNIASPTNTSRNIPTDPLPIDRNPFRSSGKFARSGFSDLPVLEEETQLDPEYFPPPQSLSEDPNRDSAFVTGSPNPSQGAFVDNKEHIRDSGVHLRDLSPAPPRTPISTSDAAISRLPWPVVDEDSETVYLDKARAHDVETPDKKARKSRRGEEVYKPKDEANRSFEVYQTKEKSNRGNELYLPKSEQVKEFFTPPRAESAERRTSHREASPSSRDLLPSQRGKEERHSDLHRTSTIHGHGGNKSHEHHNDIHSIADKHSSQRPKSEVPAEAHQSQTVHRTEDVPHAPREETAGTRGTSPSPRAVHEYTSLRAPETPRRPVEESLVKKRLQKFETPEVKQSAKLREGGSVKDRVQRLQSPEVITPSISKEESYSELSHLRRPKAEQPQGISDNTIAAGAALAGAAALGFAAARQLSQEKRPGSAASTRSNTGINRLRTPTRPDSVNSNRTSTPPLRRSDRKISGDLRSLSQRSQADLAKEAELAAITSSAVNATVNTPTPLNPTANEGRVRSKDMADVYDGFGEGRMGSPRSPTRPHSMRRRQSMQVLDLESKVEQLAAENRMLAEAKAQAERSLLSSTSTTSALIEKDAEIDALKRTLDWLQNEVSRLTEVNDGLNSANITLGHQQNERYNILESQHAQTTRELQESRDAQIHMSSGMEGIIVAQIQTATQGKDHEIAQLRAELENAKRKIREMQAQILMSKTSDIDFLTIRDEDYFDNACQQLCQHVQQWVLRFSKFSDMRACRLTSEINNDKTIDRLDNAILDGSDVDSYLTDRVKRRDVFMSMTMTMVWEFIFTRYLFGMDREQRQKLKSLEKLLSEVGPAAAVHQWRATTLTLLSKRDAFSEQREQDTQAVVHAIMETLSEILPPPSQLEDQIEQQLKRVIKAAVDLSIEMRTQRAEYMMLPPLQPEYDANGDLASKVSFNAALMNERSGDTISNEDLENNKAVVRIVLFPLVVKKGDDRGEGDEEIVVCPAQVLVAKPKKSVRMMSPGKNLSRASMQSSMPADYNDMQDDEGSVV